MLDTRKFLSKFHIFHTVNNFERNHNATHKTEMYDNRNDLYVYLLDLPLETGVYRF